MLKRIAIYPRSFIVVSILALCVFLTTTCMNNSDQAAIIKNASGKQFAGSASCAGCHKAVYDSHIHTAHYLTSQPATEEYIKGSFEPGKNQYAFNRSVVVSMEKRKDGFYQVEYFRDEEKRAQRFDIVVGSGNIGQSYLYWTDNRLYQLPITYFGGAHTWSNSPGFPDKVVFNRSITSRCLECHTTFAKTISEPGKEPESFDKQQIVYGVDCEKCHGPAAEHVSFHQQNKTETKGKFILNPASFSRQQNMDLCASCHGGRLQKTKPSFTFMAGDTLSNYFLADTTTPDPNHIDVHANQYGLLRGSKCFRMSNSMTCNTCHNTHENEKGKTEIFSQRCMSCHSTGHNNVCKLTATIGDAIKSNCIDCHMPVQLSRAIAVKLQGNDVPTAASIRSHYISIYNEETRKVLPSLKK
jgi:hypothetical protein